MPHEELTGLSTPTVNHNCHKPAKRGIRPNLAKVIANVLLDFCSDLISIYLSYEGSKTIESLQKPARWSLWRSTYVTVG
jgi:hypothetical protein